MLALDRSSLYLIIFEAVLVVLANFLIFSGIKSLDASTASIIEIAYPFFVVLFSYVIFLSTPNIYFFIGGILVFVGCSIIIKFT
jgi:drug/metabolite transporter (DMT)-like permease